MLRTTSLTLYLSILCFSPATARQIIDPAGIHGRLLIGGGGGLPDEIFTRFAELAGGSKGRLVLIPTASARADDPERMRELLTLWQKRFPGEGFVGLVLGVARRGRRCYCNQTQAEGDRARKSRCGDHLSYLVECHGEPPCDGLRPLGYKEEGEP